MRSSYRRENDAARFFAALLLVFCFLTVPKTGAFSSEVLKAHPKSEWGAEDVHVSGYPPNVLLLIDVGSPMIWTPQTKMPSEMINIVDTPIDGCTYGDGSLPTTRWGPDATRIYRFGRDLDPSNNDIYNDDCYYNNLIFRDQNYSRENPKPNYGTGDLIPNDSRMYKMKLVLWRLLERTDLIGDTNLGLATFWQEYDHNTQYPSYADWYKVHPYMGGPDWLVNPVSRIDGIQYDAYYDSQLIDWGVYIGDYYDGNQLPNKARLRVPIMSVNDSDVADRIKTLIDGHETPDNDELRADGKAPLARAIYSDKVEPVREEDNGDLSGTVWHFFNNTKMAGVCQTNWLVVLTAGDDNIGGESPVESVKNLYRNSGTLNGVNLDFPVRTLVMGFVDPEDNSSGSVKLRDTLNKMAFYGRDDGYDEEGNPRPYVEPDEGESYAFFANDVPGLLLGFTKVFEAIQSGRFGSNAAVVGKAPGGGEDFVAYAPSYIRKGSGQWQGDLRKMDTRDGTTLWSAEENLPSPEKRNIYTVKWESDGNPGRAVANLVHFAPERDPQSKSAFASEMGFDESRNKDLNDFIGWVRGYKKYGQGSDARRDHVLTDMENSGLVLVGAPDGSYVDGAYGNFKETWKKRKKCLYIQSNAGMLHAFDPDTGAERWAFVPPNSLAAYRMTSLRFVTKADKDGGYSIESYLPDQMSLPHNLLDGPIAVGDVRLPEGDYATVLVGFLGKGGAGMYAMDVTDPENPRFLWAVENLFDLDEEDEGRKLYWVQKSQSGTAGCDLHEIDEDDSPLFNLLGFTLTGAPSIGRVHSDEGEKSVIVLSGGVGTEKDGRIGHAIYVVDVLTGQIVRYFLQAADNTGRKTDLGAVLSPASVYSTEMRDRVIEGFFASDSMGSVLMGRTKGSWKLDRIWSLSCPYSRKGVQFENLVNPLPLSVGLVKNDVWALGGTSNLALSARSGFENDINIIYSLNSNAIVNSVGYRDFSNEDMGMVDRDEGDESRGSLGWFMPLAGGSSKMRMEYCTTAPLLSHGAAFVGTYQEAVQEDKCATSGYAHLYIMDMTTGKGLCDKEGKKRITFGGLKIAGISAAGDKVVLSVKKMQPFTMPEDTGDVKIEEKGDVLEIDLSGLKMPVDTDSQTPKAIYWRELFYF